VKKNGEQTQAITKLANKTPAKQNPANKNPATKTKPGEKKTT